MCWRDIGQPVRSYRRRPLPCEESTARKTIFSPDRVYRYTLWREWSMPLIHCACGGCENRKYVMFIGLNPSTADETKDDNTIRKCIKYAKAWGYGALCMTNLFAYRATDPRKMKAYPQPIGDENDKWLVDCARKASMVVAAWGRDGAFMKRDLAIEKILNDLKCLGQNNDGTPKHPLYLKDTATPDTYWMKEPF